MTVQEIDLKLQTQVVQALLEKLMAYYVFPEIAGQICIRLEKHLNNGDYIGITEGDFFAYALTQHIQEVNHNEHLWVKWHPESLPDEGETLRQNKA